MRIPDLKFPYSIFTAFSHESDLAHFEPHPEELLLLSGIRSERRRRDLLLGRLAARKALATIEPACSEPLLRGPTGLPIWPSGIVGSISHSGGAAAAAVGRDTDWHAIGIDLQSTVKTPSPRLLQRIAAPQTPSSLHEMLTSIAGNQPLNEWASFSLKESAIKALSSCIGKTPYFSELSFEAPTAGKLSLVYRGARVPGTSLHICGFENSVITLCAIVPRISQREIRKRNLDPAL